MARRKENLIYGLVDPRTWEIRYVGKSTSGLSRPQAHLHKSNIRRRDHVHAWVRQLVSQGLTYGIVILEKCAEAANLPHVERCWIAKLRFEGCRLTNLTDGGEGAHGRKYSTETIAKMSKAQKGKTMSVEHKARLLAIHTGRKHSEESKVRISLSLTKAHLRRRVSNQAL